ncbi:MAG: HD domain-containing protein [Candidatus Cyclobacteriaceae bacterium M2_1C_046]
MDLLLCMNYTGAKKYALDRLKNELPENLFYHHVHHTLDVCQAIENIANAERINGEDLTLLKTAGIFHDLGFVVQYMDNEPVAVEIAKEVLPSFKYSDEQIKIICDLILATKIPHNPQTHLEMIICDADLDYLGREDFHSISQSLMKEWLANGLVKTEEEFNRKQVSFFNMHQYYTQTAKKRREALKKKHLSEIKSLL